MSTALGWKEVLSRVHIFPIRHHSPRSSQVLKRFLDEVKPELVLVEGPHDADPTIEVLLESATAPPVAILGYRTDQTTGTSLFPFAEYSPEYVALRWAKENKASSRFIDISTGQGIAADVSAETPTEKHDEIEEVEPSLSARLADERGFRSFEEMWEASFEAPDYSPNHFRQLLISWAECVRHHPHRLEFHKARDAFMTARIVESAKNTPPEKIAVVVGAAHASAFVALDVQPELEATLEASVPTAVTLIPFSYTRLAEQTGYGAGNRAPHYYQRAFLNSCDFRRATLEVLVHFTEHLRLRGFTASLADTIEAYRLACTLSDIRGKSGPGLDEVREATIATLCRGDSSHVDGFLWPSVVGHAVGKVAASVGRNSLQQEFWAEVKARNLPMSDSAERFVLKLNESVQIETSIFLHRLRVANIPYANFVGTESTTGRNAKPTEAAAGGVAALTRPREHWEAQWTPSTDVALLQRIAHGNSFAQVCERLLVEQLSKAISTGAAAEILMESVVTSAPQAMARALLACDSFAATDDALDSLAVACRSLSSLVSFGTSRTQANIGEDAVLSLCEKTFSRALLRVRNACMSDDAGIAVALAAIRTLHEVAASQKAVDGDSWFRLAEELCADFVIHPNAAGLACGLLYLAQCIDETQVNFFVTQRLSNHFEPSKGAAFLVGFFEVNALVLVKSKPIVKAFDEFLCAIDPSQFKDALPMLRKAFGALGATERRYLLENLLSIRNLGSQAKVAASIIRENDKEKLKSISNDISKVMDDLDDLL